MSATGVLLNVTCDNVVVMHDKIKKNADIALDYHECADFLLSLDGVG